MQSSVNCLTNAYIFDTLQNAQYQFKTGVTTINYAIKKLQINEPSHPDLVATRLEQFLIFNIEINID